jgi:hypothetical protein
VFRQPGIIKLHESGWSKGWKEEREKGAIEYFRRD